MTDNANDQGQLIPMVDAVKDEYGEVPQEVLADANYCNERDLKGLEARDIDGYVSLAREGQGRRGPDPDEYPAKARMAEKLASEEGRRRYARRKWIAEAPVGWIKEVMGFRRFSFRGLKKVEAEWTLVCPRSTSSGCTPFKRHEAAIVDPQLRAPGLPQVSAIAIRGRTAVPARHGPAFPTSRNPDPSSRRRFSHVPVPSAVLLRRRLLGVFRAFRLASSCCPPRFGDPLVSILRI